MSNYIIGIDGGGTKTLGVLFDESGTEVARTEQGFANFRVDKETAKTHLIATINALTATIDLKDLAFIQIGVAGVPDDAYKQMLLKELKATYKTPVDLVTDATIALYSIRKHSDDCVIMVLGGTGSAIMVKDGDKDRLIGGFGHLLGDEGSGYHLAISALRNIIQQYEEDKPITPLSRAILDQIHAPDYFAIKDFVYNSSKKQIAKLSEFIARHANAGDVEAIELFRQEGRHLARQTLTAFRQLETCRQVTIGFRGGFLLNAPYVRATMIAELDKSHVQYKIDEEPVEPVVGAYYLGHRQSLNEVKS